MKLAELMQHLLETGDSVVSFDDGKLTTLRGHTYIRSKEGNADAVRSVGSKLHLGAILEALRNSWRKTNRCTNS